MTAEGAERGSPEPQQVLTQEGLSNHERNRADVAAAGEDPRAPPGAPRLVWGTVGD